MENAYERNPLYRFFNVLLFLAYSFVVLVTVLIAYLNYENREIVSAIVQCKDGTEWNAKNILYDSYALCGICTKRTPDNKRYQNCTYEDVDYNAYETKITRKSWDWSIVTYPLIAFAIGFGLADFIKLIIVYIFSGRIAFEKSLLINILALFSERNTSESFDKEYGTLFQIIDREEIIKLASLRKHIPVALEGPQKQMRNLCKAIGIREEAVEQDNNFLKLTPEQIEQYENLKKQIIDLNILDAFLVKHFDLLEETHNKIKTGLSIKLAKSEYKRALKKLSREELGAKMKAALSKALGEEIANDKRKKGDRFDEKESIDKGWQERITKKLEEEFDIKT